MVGYPLVRLADLADGSLTESLTLTQSSVRQLLPAG